MVQRPEDREAAAYRRGLRILASIMTCVCAILAGCASNSGALSAYDLGSGADDALLSVTNQHPHHVEISVQPLDGSEFDLGSARVASTREFRLPRTLSGRPARVILRCIRTGEIHQTRDITWNPADRLVLAVRDLLPLSDIALPPR